MFSIHADLRLDIDGRSATLTGSGKRLTLELESARMVRTLSDIELPRLHGAAAKPHGTVANTRNMPGILAGLGLSVEVRDRKGPLFVVGADAAGASISLPFLGKVEHVSLAGVGALRRLAIGR